MTDEQNNAVQCFQRNSTLSNQAVLVRLSVSQWTGYKFDKKATEKVEANHGANNHAGEVGRFSKQLASKKYMKDLSSNITNARTYHYDQTLPWQDAEGVRILPVKNYQNYQQKMSEYRSKHEQVLDKFVQDYPDLICSGSAGNGEGVLPVR